MTEPEARTVALLRMHFGCTFGKLAMCCQALWDAATAPRWVKAW
jgi:hypothetical protein